MIVNGEILLSGLLVILPARICTITSPIDASESSFRRYEGFRSLPGLTDSVTVYRDESYSVIPGGASGIPRSEFYLSQLKTYTEGKFYKDAFSDEAVKASTRYIKSFIPAD